MNALFAGLIALLFGVGLFLVLRRTWLKLIIGLALIGHGCNLLIFLFGGLAQGRPAIVAETQKVLAPSAADPLPQALILTAIVIGFGMQAFMVVLFRSAYQAFRVEDLDRLEENA